MDMDQTQEATNLKHFPRHYYLAHPEHAGMDLRIFRAFFAGHSTDQIKAAIPCDTVTVSQSLCRIDAYIHSANLRDVVSLFRSLLVGGLQNKSSSLPVIETLYTAYSEQGLMNPDEARRDFDHLYELMDGLSDYKTDVLYTSICQLCGKHERDGFWEGVKVGYQLEKELRS